MINTFPPNCKKPTAQIVLLGTVPSGIDFLFKYQHKFKKIKVTLFEKSELGPFLLEALLLTRGKHMISNPNGCSSFQIENITITIIRSSISSIKEEERLINHSDGKIRYDYLLIGKAQPIKVFSNCVQSLGTLLCGAEQSDNKLNKEDVVLVEGQDLFAIAIAIRLLHFGIVPVIICHESRFASKELPEEEAWLVGKYLKQIGVESIFDVYLIFNSLISKKNMLEVKTSKGKTFHAHTIISTTGDFFHSLDLLRDCSVKNSHDRNTDHLDFFSVDDIGKMKSSALINKAMAEMAFKWNNRHYLLNGSPLSSQCDFSGLEWKKYGEISTNCGQDTQNFYWEHPRGEVSFRMQYENTNLLIKGISCLSLPFKSGFIESVLKEKWNAYEFIDRMKEGLVNPNQVKEVYPLVKKSFGVVFKDEIKKTRGPFIKRIIKKFFHNN
ncbi:hypothetical protein GCM10027284_34220 [Cyclobacterium sediminis]